MHHTHARAHISKLDNSGHNSYSLEERSAAFILYNGEALLLTSTEGGHNFNFL